MQRDLRDTPLFREFEGYARAWQQPGSGLIRDAADHAVSPDGRWIAFSGVQLERLEGTPTTRLCLLEASTGDLRVVTFGPNTDRQPRWSPDGRQLYFLSDREGTGRFQPYAYDIAAGAARPLPRPPGWVEYLHVSPCGSHLLLGVAGLGADLAGAQGGLQSAVPVQSLPAWMPTIEGGDDPNRWRSAWTLTLADGLLRQVTSAGMNTWEACWCGTDAIAVVASDGPAEADWYAATLRRIPLAGGRHTILHRPRHQLGWPAAAVSGRAVAIVEAVCSDRWIVAGDLLVIESGGDTRRIDTRGVDVTCTAWASEHVLMYAGMRGTETVVGRVDEHGDVEELWVGRDRTIGSRFYPDFAPVPGTNGREFVATAQGFLEPPHLVRLHDELQTLHSFAIAETQLPSGLRAESYEWVAPDGLAIQGWIVRREGAAPQPLVMDVHGGPVWAYRPRYLGTGNYWLALLVRGYALFFPNPRGSSGRGQDYALRVFGDMGGADTHDYLSGVDRLVADGIADPQRLGVMGGSYGGYMSAWLITQDTRFAAAVPIAPVTNWVSEHLTCHIPHFCEQFLDDRMTNLGGKYYTRSPVLHAGRVKTPTLNVCGALDRNTPPGQALEFHHALQLHGVESVLVTYPLEGHGVRTYPAMFDFAARVVDWFDTHLSRRDGG